MTSSGTQRHELRHEWGFTTVELAVVMLIAGILLAAAVPILTGMFRGQRQVAVRTSTTADAKTAMEQMTRELRVAVRPQDFSSAIITAQPTQVQFYSQLNRGTATNAAATRPLPTLIRYSYNGTKKCLEVSKTQMRLLPNGKLAPNPGAVQTVCIVRTTKAPAFSYYSSASVSADNASKMPANPSVSSGQLPEILSVGIDLTSMDLNATDFGGSQLITRVALTNVAQQKAVEDPSLTPTTTRSTTSDDYEANYEATPGAGGGVLQ